MNTNISIIIPTRNRPNILAGTLKAFKSQTLEQKHFEIIVVDDGSSESNREKNRKECATFPYTLLEKEHSGLAASRNHGASEAQGEILLFLDDDVIPDEDLLNQHLKTHRSEKLPLVVVGSLPWPKELKITTFLWYLAKSGHYDLYENPKKYPGGKPPMPPLNGNSSIGAKVFHDLGAYDESCKGYGGEDLEMGYRLSKQGIKFIYNPNAIGYHNHSKNFKQFCFDMEASGEALIRIYRKYPEIKSLKKIDVITDSFSELPWRKKILKMILLVTSTFPFLLIPPKLTIALLSAFFSFRHILFPCYRWIAHYHYAKGMIKGLSANE